MIFIYFQKQNLQQISSQGLDGRACVLRAICESAHTPFDYSNGILGELMHIVMTYVKIQQIIELCIQFMFFFVRPSLTKDKVNDHADNEYLHAEKLGKDGAPCEHVFKECKMSILEQFSGIYSPILDLMRAFS